VTLDFFGRRDYIDEGAQACQKFNKNNVDLNSPAGKILESIAP